MFKLIANLVSALGLSTALLCAAPASAQTIVDPQSGLIKVRSAYSMEETIQRIRKDIADKGIMFFSAVDQAQLAAGAGIKLNPSTLLSFGNPPLGAQFLTSNPFSGLDWPVRVLVLQDDSGAVWAAYTDFAWIAMRHGIRDREQQFATASGVVQSITSTIRAK
ncbi:MAG: DUF302 domain-containing protein [Burkholderiales bacterium]|jgi:uncharacterized protein (DUF302 family)|nr:DUF302 domain-containing protein [Burkholderiales bacterium]